MAIHIPTNPGCTSTQSSLSLSLSPSSSSFSPFA